MSGQNISRQEFPSDFIFGAATSSYQIEGTKLGTVGPSHWDEFAKRGGTFNNSNGDIACAHFEKWAEDLDLIKNAGMSAYRFSTAWPRIQPEGKGKPLVEGLDFYDKVIDGCLERGLEPHLTLYHWELPLALSQKGGWQSGDTAKYFADYSAIMANRYGDRVSSIATINEPWCVAWLSHFLGHHAPGLTSLEAGVKSMHNILLAHGLSMQAIRNECDANAGIVLNMEFGAIDSDKDEDIRARDLFDGIYNRWFIDAIFKGKYPENVLEYFAPHMPEGWQDDLKVISQPIDWLGLNYYTRNFILDDGTGVFPFAKSHKGDLPKTSMGWEIYPEGLEFFLNRISTEYSKDIPIFVTENGMALHDNIHDGKVEDDLRCDFFQLHLAAVKSAIENGVNVKGYFAWSLLDNFEWAFGYEERFGIVHVDFDTQERTPKNSYYMLQKMLTS
ncbi:MAG: GH1 family beta-glucosidase [Lentilitoribacter sp.]